MHRGDADKLSTPRARLPFGNLGSCIMETRFKDIGGASPGVEVAQGVSIAESAGKCLNRSDAGRLVGGIVVEIDGMG